MKWNEYLVMNIRNYCKYFDIKVKDFEKSIGVCTGYISKQLNNPTISVLTTFSIAEKLETTIDGLIKRDLFSDAIKNKQKAEIEKEIERLQGELEKI